MARAKKSNREATLDNLRNEALKIRRNVWRALRAAGSGHMGGSLSAAEFLAALYFHHLKIRPDEPDWPDRDRFILSAGHGSMFLYGWLHLAGYDLPLEEVKNFRKFRARRY